jgi:hypothetical protein
MQIDEWLFQPLPDQTASLCSLAFVEQSEQVHIPVSTSLSCIRQQTERLNGRSIETHVLTHCVLLKVEVTKIVFISCEVQIIYERRYCTHGDYEVGESCVEV